MRQSVIMYCSKCGYKLGDDAVFCSKCGERVKAEPTAQKSNVFTNKCESCGAFLKRLTPNHYICEYCGSEYFLNNEREVESSKITDKEIWDLFCKAAEFETRNNFQAELQCLRSIEGKVRDNAIYLVKLGRAYRRNDMVQQAVECYEKAKEINPEYAPIYTNMGAVYVLTNRPKDAEAACRKGIELMSRNRKEYTDTDYAVAHSNLALALGKQGKKEEAKKYLKIAEDNGYKNGDAVRKMIGIKKGWFF